MLILTRKTNESIIIGEDVRITVLGIQNGIVRLGLTAPNDVKIFREELLSRQHPNQSKGKSDDGEETNDLDLESKPVADTGS